MAKMQPIRCYQVVKKNWLGGQTSSPTFWHITLACGHTINRTTSTKPLKRARCHQCAA